LFARKKRWGRDILIYALKEGKVQLKDQIDEEKKMIEIDELKRRKREEEEKNMMELANFSNNIKSKNALKNALMESA
jgi:heterodisulfide reductase subunit C